MAILDIHDLGLAREQGARHRRRDGDRAAPAGRRARAARDPHAARPRGQAGRRHRAAVGRRRAALGRARAPAATPTRVRETTIGFEAVKAMLAGRVAGATAFWNVEGVALKRAAARHARVPRRRLRRAAPTPSSCCASRATTLDGRRADDPRHDPRAAARLRRGPEATPRAPSATMAAAEPGLDPARAARAARRGRARVHGRRPGVRRRCARARCARGRRGTCAFGILRAAARRRARVRHDAGQRCPARADPRIDPVAEAARADHVRAVRAHAPRELGVGGHDPHPLGGGSGGHERRDGVVGRTARSARPARVGRSGRAAARRRTRPRRLPRRARSTRPAPPPAAASPRRGRATSRPGGCRARCCRRRSTGRAAARRAPRPRAPCASAARRGRSPAASARSFTSWCTCE